MQLVQQPLCRTIGSGSPRLMPLLWPCRFPALFTKRTCAVRSASGHGRPYATLQQGAVDSGIRPQQERIVILGSGWGGYMLSRKLSPSKFFPTVVSPRSYFVFTPLLTNAAAGSLDFSEIVEPVRDRRSKVHLIQALARGVDLNRKVITCEASVVKSGVTESARTEESEIRGSDRSRPRSSAGMKDRQQWETGQIIEVPYDKLVIAVGCVSKTFNTPGVRENAFFFKDIGDSKRVKRRILECFELAMLPTTSPMMRKWLLHFAIVGGGPTGTEFAAGLCDLIHQDLLRVYPSLREEVRITLYDVAPTVLSMFDESLARYATDIMKREGVTIKTRHHIESLRWGEPYRDGPREMDPKGCLTLKTKEEGEVGVGMCVWATGNEVNKFVKHGLGGIDRFPSSSAVAKGEEVPPNDPQGVSWQFKKVPKIGALLVDDHLRVQLQSEGGRTAVLHDVFALGDNCMIESGSPPATAQATNQEAVWLAKRLNAGDLDSSPGFSFKNMGAIAYIGSSKGLMQIPHSPGKGEGRSKYLPAGIKGSVAWLIWKGAYLTMSVSWRNRIRMVVSWFTAWAFGRDISRY